MELITLGAITPLVGRFIEGGQGACRPDLVAERVSDACERLIVKCDAPYTTWKCRVRVDRGCFPLPREMESIIACNIDNAPAYVNPQSFEFLAAGPGELRSWSGTEDKSLEDDGLHCTMYDLPSIEYPKGDAETISDNEFAADGLHIMAFSRSPSDVGKKVSVSGLDKMNTPVSSTPLSFTPMEEVPIVGWTGGVEGVITARVADLPKSEKLYRSITGFAKPKTADHVCLYAVDPASDRMWFLAKAHPDDTRPAWRRYKIRNQSAYGSNILIYGKAAALRLSRSSDVLPVQNRTAVKLMCQAIEYENKDQLKQAVEMEAQAMRVMLEAKADHDNRGMVANVIDMELYCSNAATNREYCR